MCRCVQNTDTHGLWSSVTSWVGRESALLTMPAPRSTSYNDTASCR